MSTRGLIILGDPYVSFGSQPRDELRVLATSLLCGFYASDRIANHREGISNLTGQTLIQAKQYIKRLLQGYLPTREQPRSVGALAHTCRPKRQPSPRPDERPKLSLW